MTTPLDERERQELCDLLLQLGPDAPTLCEGWTTADLAAHLSLREHFRRWGDAKLAKEKGRGFATVVGRVRAGAPAVPWRIPGLRTLLNGSEYVIHHEDVRRANGMGPRPDRPDLDDLLWRMTGLTGRALARKIKPWSLELRPTGGRESRRFGAGEGVALVGAPVEIALYLSGRRSAAQVVVEGKPEAVAAVEAAAAGI